MNARDSLLRYLLCVCSSIGEKYASLAPRKRDTKIEPVRKPDSVEYMKTHTAQESSTITHPTPLAGISN